MTREKEKEGYRNISKTKMGYACLSHITDHLKVSDNKLIQPVKHKLRGMEADHPRFGIPNPSQDVRAEFQPRMNIVRK
jgi:hypothetical protein